MTLAKKLAKMRSESDENSRTGDLSRERRESTAMRWKEGAREERREGGERWSFLAGGE